MCAKELMMALISEAINGSHAAQLDERDFSESELCELLELSSAHDLAHIVAYSLEKRGVLPKTEAGDKLRRAMMLAAYRHEGQDYEIERVSAAFEEQGIDHALLKGAVMCHRYPVAWMRTMSDVDILVKGDDLERAVSLLCQKLGYTVRERGSHDVSLLSGGGVHIELHFCLMDEQSSGVLGQEAAKTLGAVWQTAILKENSSHSYILSEETFYIYHLSHMAKHILNGGCGVKPFVDTYILSLEKHSALADDRIKAFEDGVKSLCSVWFGGADHDEHTRALEEYVLSGGAYGNEEQRVAAIQSAKGSWGKYLLSRIFVPYHVLKTRYPILQRHRWLTPIFEVVRWIQLPFVKGISSAKRELDASAHVSRDKRQQLSELFIHLGIK